VFMPRTTATPVSNVRRNTHPRSEEFDLSNFYRSEDRFPARRCNGRRRAAQRHLEAALGEATRRTMPSQSRSSARLDAVGVVA